MLQVLKSVFRESLCCLMVCLQQLFVPPCWQQEMVWGSSVLHSQGMTNPIKGRWCKNGLYSLSVGQVPSSHKSDMLGCRVQKGTTIEGKHWAPKWLELASILSQGSWLCPASAPNTHIRLNSSPETFPLMERAIQCSIKYGSFKWSKLGDLRLATGIFSNLSTQKN